MGSGENGHRYRLVLRPWFWLEVTPGLSGIFRDTRQMTHIEEHETDLPEEAPGSERIFACLDTNRIHNPPVLLESGGLAHCCLFQGPLAEDAGNSAPWLTELTPEHGLTRNLLTSAGPAAHKAPAIPSPSGRPRRASF